MKTRPRKTSRYIAVSQLACRRENEDVVLGHVGLEQFICTVTQATHCKRSRVNCSSMLPKTTYAVAELLEMLLLFLPELMRAGLDVVVLDDIQSVHPSEIQCVSEQVNRLMNAGLRVVAWNGIDDFVDLCSFRDVVCTDDFIRIILRDLMTPTDIEHDLALSDSGDLVGVI